MAVRSEHWVQADMYRTASNWTSRVLLRAGGHRLNDGAHTPAWKLRSWATSGRQLFGTVREPCAWLCSYWDYLHVHGRHEPLKAISGGSTDFDAYVRGSLAGAFRTEDAALGPLSGGEGDLWSRFTRIFYGSPDSESWAVDVLVDCSQVREGLSRMGLADTLPPKNVSPPQRKAAREGLMTPELRRLVYATCGGLAASLGYHAPFQPSDSVLLRFPAREAA